MSVIEAKVQKTIEAIKLLSLAEIERMAEHLQYCLEHGGTIFTCGNGGSACEAMRFTEELLGRYKHDRAPMASVCLNADMGSITRIANDFGYDYIFSRQLAALAKHGDRLLVFSTSGDSPNIVEAARATDLIGIPCDAMLGKDGGNILELCDNVILATSDTSDVIQECHQVALHCIFEWLEANYGQADSD